MQTIPPYPLAWPDDQPRSARRERSRFKVTLASAMGNVKDSLRKFANDSGRGLKGVQITANVGLMNNKPDDPGVSVWFEWDGGVRCIAVDRYESVQENLQAIHHVLEARRTELRHAGIQMVRTTFRGFTAALPSPNAKRNPWGVIGVDHGAPDADVQAAYKAAMRVARSEGNEAREVDLNVARDDIARQRAQHWI